MDKKAEIQKILESVTDPEIPVLTIQDLGIIRDIVETEDDKLEIFITPTYSGCPAMNTIEINIKSALQAAGYQNINVISVLSPAWTTAWISEEGKRKLKAYGIAPPVEDSQDKNALFQEDKKIECPQCNSMDTKMISQFGSTACKALYKCNSCLEPFDYFKCH